MTIVLPSRPLAELAARPVGSLVDALLGRTPVRVSWPDGTQVSGYATRVEESELGQWLTVTGDDGHQYRIAATARVRIDWGRT